MATNSDFAQKLLRDLRLRKERMASSQHSSSHSTIIARGSTNAYTNRGPSHGGHRRINSLDSVGSSTLKSYSRSNGGNRSLNLQESSTQVVAYGRGRSTSNVGDLSKAFAFALQNGGKSASANNSMINFLHHIGWRSMENSSVQKHRSSDQFPTYSYFHVKEISKGVQNLNQILRACSNGLNFDRYSIEIGKDLLKGAMDLEESLRMLVSLQEASEYMVTPQRKNRIRLLEEDEEEEEQNMTMTHNRQLMELPRFSFDKPARNSYRVKEVAKADFKRLLALTYEVEQPIKQAPTSDNVPYKRSLQSETEKHSTSPQSDMRKGRISNVIAKLMGLNELPEKLESKTVQKERNSKKREETILKKIATTDTALQRTDDTQNIVPPTVNKRRIQGSKIPQSTPNFMSALKAENDLQFADRANAVGSKRLTSPLDKEGEGENCYTKNRENKMTEKLETKEKSADDKLQHREMQKQRSSEAESMLKETSIDRKGTSPTTEKNKSETLLQRNQLQTFQKCASQEPKHHLRNEMFQSRKINGSQAESYGTTRLSKKQQILQKKQPLVNQAISSTRSSKQCTDAVNSKELSISKHHGNHTKDESPANYKAKMDSSQRDLKHERIKAKADVPQSVQRKSVHVSSSQRKVGSAQVHSKQAPERKHEVFPRRKGILPNSTMTSKHQGPILQEMEQSNKEEINVLNKGDMKFMGFSHLVANIQAPTGVEIHNEAELTGFENKAGGGDCQSLNLLQTLAPNESGHDELPEASKVCADYGDKEPVSIEHAEHNFDEVSPNFCIGSNRGSIEVFCPSPDDYERISTLGAEEPFTEPEKVKHETVSCSEAQEYLTRPENHLKEALTRSQFFIDTAEALFNLKIPTGQVLNANGYTCHDDNSKLILDCAYEVMKRLGTRQELAANPYLKISISCMVNSWDELIKQLHKDIESLQYYGGNGSQECDAADCLHKMIEKDVQNRVPNVNSMWDFSWDRTIFASFEKYDVTWDLERYLLNGLLDEMTKDLLSMYPCCPLELQRGINGAHNLTAPHTTFQMRDHEF